MSRKFINSPTAYALGMFAMMVPSQAFASFFNYYYVEKLGLSLGLATIARTIYLIWDAVNNPMAGYLSDRTRTRYGRRRPWIFFSTPAFYARVHHGLLRSEGTWQYGVIRLAAYFIDSVRGNRYTAVGELRGIVSRIVRGRQAAGESIRGTAGIPDHSDPNWNSADSNSVRSDWLRMDVGYLLAYLRYIHDLVCPLRAGEGQHPSGGANAASCIVS